MTGKQEGRPGTLSGAWRGELSWREKTGPGGEYDWVDEFIARVRPYIYVRTEDSLLIKRPNQAAKLNDSGALLLKQLLAGTKFVKIQNSLNGDAEKLHRVLHFLLDVKRYLEGVLTDSNAGCGVEIRPFEMNFSKLPVLSEVALTYRCNLRCCFCYAGCNCTVNPIGSGEEMSTARVIRILKTIARKAKVPSVSFTGGEPTLREDLCLLISRAKKLGLRVNLITNGQKVDLLMARRLTAAGLDSAQVSVEGVTAGIHEKLTGVVGSFRRSVNAVKFLKKAGVLTHTNTTINLLNREECREMPRFVREELENERFSMNLVIPTGSAAFDRELVVTYSEVGPLLEEIRERSEAMKVEFMWYSPTPMCMFNPIAAGLGNRGCSACDGLLSVAPNGDVLPCPSFPESVGNLIRQNFDRVWQSPQACNHRRKYLAHPGCRHCENFEICNGGCPLYWQNRGFTELEKHRGFAAANDDSDGRGPGGVPAAHRRS